MNSSCSGMKRSMPCVDLNSMVSQKDTRRPFQCLDGHVDVKWENLAPKKRRLSPLDTKRSLVNPATEALDHFLRMSVDDLIPDFFDLEEDFPMNHEVSHDYKLFYSAGAPYPSSCANT